MISKKEEKQILINVILEMFSLAIFIIVALCIAMTIQWGIGFITGIFVGYEVTTENFIELLNSNLTKEQIIQVI